MSSISMNINSNSNSIFNFNVHLSAETNNTIMIAVARVVNGEDSRLRCQGFECRARAYHAVTGF